MDFSKYENRSGEIMRQFWTRVVAAHGEGDFNLKTGTVARKACTEWYTIKEVALLIEAMMVRLSIAGDGPPIEETFSDPSTTAETPKPLEDRLSAKDKAWLEAERSKLKNDELRQDDPSGEPAQSS